MLDPSELISPLCLPLYPLCLHYSPFSYSSFSSWSFFFPLVPSFPLSCVTICIHHTVFIPILPPPPSPTYPPPPPSTPFYSSSSSLLQGNFCQSLLLSFTRKGAPSPHSSLRTPFSGSGQTLLDSSSGRASSHSFSDSVEQGIFKLAYFFAKSLSK